MSTEAKSNKHSKLKKIGKIITLPIFVYLAILVSQIVCTIILSMFKDLSNLSTSELGLYSVMAYFTSAAVIIFIPKQLSKKQSSTRDDLGLKGLPTFTDIGLVIAGIIAFFILSEILTILFSLFPWFDASEAQDVGFSDLYTVTDKLIAYFSLCVLAPVAEEIIFRGWLYNKLRETIRNKKKSIIISMFFTSLIFAILHGQWNVGVAMFAMSIIMCVMRELTGTIYSGILLHILKNTIAFILVFIMM